MNHLFPNIWGIFGGVENFDLLLEDAVRREFREKIGININTSIEMIVNNINNDKIIFIVLVTYVI